MHMSAQSMSALQFCICSSIAYDRRYPKKKFKKKLPCSWHNGAQTRWCTSRCVTRRGRARLCGSTRRRAWSRSSGTRRGSSFSTVAWRSTWRAGPCTSPGSSNGELSALLLYLLCLCYLVILPRCMFRRHSQFLSICVLVMVSVKKRP